MNNKIIIGGVVAAIIVLILAIVLFAPTQEVFYDSIGDIDVKSSSLKFTYNNDESIYGAFTQDGTLDHVLYYDEAKVSGNVKFDLNDVEWDSTYVPSNTTDDDGNDIVHENNVTWAENNFTDELMKDYEAGNVSVEVDFYLQDDTGYSIHSHSAYGYDSYDGYGSTDLSDAISSFTLEDGIATMKVYYDYHSNTTETITNGADYEGNLLSYQNDDDEVSQAEITMRFYNDKYDVTLTGIVSGDDITVSHM